MKIRLNQIRLNICCFGFWLLVFFVFQSWCKVSCKILIEAFKSSMFACFIHCCNIRFNQQIMHAYSIFSNFKNIFEAKCGYSSYFYLFFKKLQWAWRKLPLRHMEKKKLTVAILLHFARIFSTFLTQPTSEQQIQNTSLFTQNWKIFFCWGVTLQN